MSHFGARPRFEQLSDGVVRAREGTQTNCGGIAQITAYMFDEDAPGLTVSFEPDGIEPLSQLQVPGRRIPAELQAVIVSGAQEAHAEVGPDRGLEVCVISAVVHPVDANLRVFRACARRLVRGWLSG